MACKNLCARGLHSVPGPSPTYTSIDRLPFVIQRTMPRLLLTYRRRQRSGQSYPFVLSRENSNLVAKPWIASTALSAASDSWGIIRDSRMTLSVRTGIDGVRRKVLLRPGSQASKGNETPTRIDRSMNMFPGNNGDRFPSPLVMQVLSYTNMSVSLPEATVADGGKAIDTAGRSMKFKRLLHLRHSCERLTPYATRFLVIPASLTKEPWQSERRTKCLVGST